MDFRFSYTSRYRNPRNERVCALCREPLGVGWPTDKLAGKPMSEIEMFQHLPSDLKRDDLIGSSLEALSRTDVTEWGAGVFEASRWAHIL
jgi:hypothetical protein